MLEAADTRSPTGQRVLRYVDALAEAFHQEMERDPDVFLFGLDVDDHKAIQGSTRGLLQRFGAERIFTTPLSEDAMTGVAIGAAMAGMRPIHTHIRMDFLLLCMNQLINIAAKAHAMYGGAVKVPLVVRSMIGKSWGQGAQHSQALHSMFMHVPGLKVVSPSNAYDAKGCMIAAIRDDNPVIVMEHRLLYPTEAFVPEEPYEVAPGKARVVAAGQDVTIVAVSNMVLEALRARELLADLGISVEVIDPIWLSPLDIDTIAASALRTRRLLVADNGWSMCGAGAEIIAQVLERSEPEASIAVKRVGFAPTTCPPSPALEERFYPNVETLVALVQKWLGWDPTGWSPDPERTKLAHQIQFRGPF
ncbi:transketolase C-terminal domain-containing protein (plasmid) [Azospirillum sp. HJ39]|uniref:alpha-ketoacid dehydrogenase subunit beta n=1 Tax=Azospirillum sp. HJ39 TaxID=3159496 RepID=UPI003556807A